MTRQPKAVWAVAFACVVAFMGIGLVDPILPAIAKDLQASPSQVELLFTSYFAFTGVSMLVTGWVSSRIGPRRTLLAGLALPWLAGKLAEWVSPSTPFFVGAAAVAVALIVLVAGRRHLDERAHARIARINVARDLSLADAA